MRDSFDRLLHGFKVFELEDLWSLARFPHFLVKSISSLSFFWHGVSLRKEQSVFEQLGIQVRYL